MSRCAVKCSGAGKESGLAAAAAGPPVDPPQNLCENRDLKQIVKISCGF